VRQNTRALRYEQLGARVMLTTYYLDPSATTWDTTSTVWHENTPTNMPETTWPNNAQNIAVIQGANGPTTITVSASVSALQAAAIVIGSGGPYTLLFPQSSLYQIFGGTVSLPSQSSLSIDVVLGGTVKVTSTIVGSGQLVTTGTGTLVVGGPNDSYIGGTDIEYGMLQLSNGATLGAPTGLLQVGGQGTLDLHGCSITVGGLEDGSSTGGPNQTDGGTVTDKSNSGTNGLIDAMTILTVDIPSTSTTYSFDGTCGARRNSQLGNKIKKWSNCLSNSG